MHRAALSLAIAGVVLASLGLLIRELLGTGLASPGLATGTYLLAAGEICSVFAIALVLLRSRPRADRLLGGLAASGVSVAVVAVGAGVASGRGSLNEHSELHGTFWWELSGVLTAASIPAVGLAVAIALRLLFRPSLPTWLAVVLGVVSALPLSVGFMLFGVLLGWIVLPVAGLVATALSTGRTAPRPAGV